MPVGPLPWAEVFADPTLPLVVDVGCGYGRFLLLLAKRERAAGLQRNYLGMEIRRPIIERANKWAHLIGLGSMCHFVSANATVSYESCLASYPGPIELTCIQFPDPMFKMRHRKRRTVQPRLVDEITRVIKPGSKVFLQSDVCSVAVDMRDMFEEFAGDAYVLDELHRREGATFIADPDLALEAKWSKSEAKLEAIAKKQQAAQLAEEAGEEVAAEQVGAFVSKWRQGGWLVENPLKAPTERELYTQQSGAFGGRAHRVLLNRV